jgi:hypothetical protein
VQALNLTSALWGAALALVLPLVWRRWRARQRSAAPAAPSPEPLSQRRAR